MKWYWWALIAAWYAYLLLAGGMAVAKIHRLQRLIVQMVEKHRAERIRWEK